MKNNPHRTPIAILVFVLFASASGVLAEQDDPLARSAAEFLSELDLAIDRTNSVLNWNSGPQTAITNDYGIFPIKHGRPCSLSCDAIATNGQRVANLWIVIHESVSDALTSMSLNSIGDVLPPADMAKMVGLETNTTEMACISFTNPLWTPITNQYCFVYHNFLMRIRTNQDWREFAFPILRAGGVEVPDEPEPQNPVPEPEPEP